MKIIQGLLRGLTRIYDRVCTIFDTLDIRRRKHLDGRFLVIVLGFVTTFFFAYYNSFQISSKSEENGAFIAQSFLAAWQTPSADIRDQITVLTYDSQSQAFFTESAAQPILFDTVHPPYAVQARVIRQLTSQGARVIFLDFSFRRYKSDPDGLADLIDAIAQARSKGINVYVGGVDAPPRVVAARSQDAWVSEIAETPYEAFKAYVSADDGMPVADPGDPVANRGKGVVREVAVTWNAEHNIDYPAVGHDALYTPAFAIVSDLCARNPLQMAYCADLTPELIQQRAIKRQDQKADGPLPDMVVQWRTFSPQRDPNPDPKTRKFSPQSDRNLDPKHQSCQILSQGSALTWSYSFFKNLFRRAAQEKDYRANPCLYLRSRPVHLLFSDYNGFDPILAGHRPSGGAYPSAQGQAGYGDFIRDEIAGRIVMVGSALDDDSFDAPGQGAIAGVHMHAMALENLLTYGAAYHHWPQETPMLLGGKISLDYFLTGLLSVVSAALIVWLARSLQGQLMLEARGSQAKHEAAATAVRHDIRWLVTTALSAALIALTLSLAAGWLTYHLLNWTSLNALNVMAASLSIFAIVENEQIKDRITHIRRTTFLKWLGGGILLIFALAGPLVFTDLVVYFSGPGQIAPLGAKALTVARALIPAAVFVLYVTICIFILPAIHKKASPSKP